MKACADHEGKIVLLLSQCGEAQNVYFRAALIRVTHQAFGALRAAYVCLFVYVCGGVFLYDSTDYFSLSPSQYLRHTHVPAWRGQVCDRLGVLGLGHPLSLSLSLCRCFSTEQQAGLCTGPGRNFNLFGKY